MRRNFYGLALCAMLCALSFPVEAQQPAKIPRIGFVSAGNLSRPGSRVEAFRKALHEIGYTDGKTFWLRFGT
jgi:hypothetical protein